MTSNRAVSASVAVALLAALLAALAAFSGASASKREKLKDTEIREIGRAWSKRVGETAPRLMRYVESRRGTAVLAMSTGDIVPDTSEVFLIEMEGEFVAEGAPHPQGARAPSGSVLSVVVDAYTGQTMDIGIHDRPTELAKLGEVTTVLPADLPIDVASGSDPGN